MVDLALEAPRGVEPVPVVEHVGEGIDEVVIDVGVDPEEQHLEGVEPIVVAGCKRVAPHEWAVRVPIPGLGGLEVVIGETVQEPSDPHRVFELVAVDRTQHGLGHLAVCMGEDGPTVVEPVPGRCEPAHPFQCPVPHARIVGPGTSTPSLEGPADMPWVPGLTRRARVNPG